MAGAQGPGLAQGLGQGQGGKGGNAKRGDTWLLLDGMVLDITRWLPEHPGGSEIIPQQSLNVDATVFFEIYHASRQSFLYLKVIDVILSYVILSYLYSYTVYSYPNNHCIVM